MLPDGQQRLVFRSPAEIEAVRLIRPRPKIRSTKRKEEEDDELSENRKTRTHIGDNGIQTELWVCRTSFKVEKRCNAIKYLESPRSYPMGTKDSWVHHMKDVHLGEVGRVIRAA
jgi:hypothetical protein